MKLEDELAYEYINCRAADVVADNKVGRIEYWRWLHKTHPSLYAKMVYRIKEEDEDVERVRQRLLKEGH